MPRKSKNQYVEDIFAETNKEVKAVPRVAKVSPKSKPASTSRAVPTPSAQQAPQKKKSRATLIVLLSFTAVVVIGGSAVAMSFGLFTNGTPATNTSSSVIDTGTASVNAVVNTEPVFDFDAEPLPTVEDIGEDTDGDGLTDAQEKELRTNISLSDTDSDGLFDREEVEVYKTDPLSNDTDEDGHTDGDEVKRGFNPKGDGVLRDIDTAISEL